MRAAVESAENVEVAGSRPPAGRSTFGDTQTWRLAILLALTGCLWVGFHFQTDQLFITPRNLSNLTVQTGIMALVALGTTWVLIVKEIDLASGSLLSLSGVVVVKLQVAQGWSIPVAIASVIGIGAIIGLVHGIGIVKFRVPSFIMTLAGLMYLSGLSFVISKGFVVSGTGESFYKLANSRIPVMETRILGIACLVVGGGIWLNGFVEWRRGVGGGRIRLDRVRIANLVAAACLFGVGGIFLWTYVSFGGLPSIVAVLGVAAAVMWFVGRYSVFGRHLYATGGNPEAARRAGVRVHGIVVTVFIVAAVLAALGGVLQASRLDAGSPDVGSLIPLNAISAAVIGGTSLFGGRGSIPGTLIGALILGSILNGLSLMAVNTYYQYVAIAWILVGVVAIDAATQRRMADG